MSGNHRSKRLWLKVVMLMMSLLLAGMASVALAEAANPSYQAFLPKPSDLPLNIPVDSNSPASSQLWLSPPGQVPNYDRNIACRVISEASLPLALAAAERGMIMPTMIIDTSRKNPVEPPVDVAIGGTTVRETAKILKGEGDCGTALSQMYYQLMWVASRL